MSISSDFLRTLYLLLAALATIGFALLVTGCGGSSTDSSSSSSDASEGAEQEQTSDVPPEVEIGPIKEVELGPIDPELAAEGEELFTTRCSSCHKMDERYVGPALRDVTEKRSAVYVMNMMLNPDQMIKEHPTAQKLLQEFMTPMTNQNIQEENARAILEYLRQMSEQDAEVETASG